MEEIGRLNQRIEILGNVTDVDRIGNHKPTWKTLFSVWANVAMKNTVTSSTEESNTGVTKEIQQTIFKVRQSSKTKNLTTTTHRIRFLGDEYDIKGMNPDYTKKDYLRITCELRKAGA
jgi:head-tail adaptor